MRILLTGATGYIGKRLLIQLLDAGHNVVCVVRDINRFNSSKYSQKTGKLEIVEGDFSEASTLRELPIDVEAAYYLLHSMSSAGDFMAMERKVAENFKEAMQKTNARQVIFLTGIINEKRLSKHLKSRKIVEETLQSSYYGLTCLRAGIIVGAGSASFEIIRDLVEKLPFMIAPKWLKTRCQPIAIRNVVQFLEAVLGQEDCYNQNYDIAGKEIFTYKEMLLEYAKARGLKRIILLVPIMTPRLSSYWLYFITSTPYALAKNLVDSMAVDIIAKPNRLAERFGISLLTYREAIDLAFDKIKQNVVVSSWYDSFSEHFHSRKIWKYLEVPDEGCFKDVKEKAVADEPKTVSRIFGIGGKNGWYYANFLWTIRGSIDRLFGGVGAGRGRRNSEELEAGDTVDFWRVLYANKEEKRLLLFAEMRIPGEAWLEFKIQGGKLYQTATYRPLGLTGRLYWYSMLPFHWFIFKGMIHKLTEQ